jgi:hypothetical protein
MAKMLKRELNPAEQAQLANLLLQPGWPLVEEMFSDFCTLSTQELLQVKPTDDRFRQKLVELQLRANIANDVCSSILKSIQVHAHAYLSEQEAEQAAQQIASKVRSALREQSNKDNTK